jgi:hypothetical protein
VAHRVLARVADWPLGRFALIAYLVVLVFYVANNGIPTDRIDQTIWILIGIVAARLGRPFREHIRAVVDWIPLLGALLLYDYTRGIADTLGMPIRVSELVDAERLLFFGEIPTVWLQERFYTPGVTQWWDVLAGVVYMSHFVVPWALAAGFYMVSRERWWSYIRMVLLLSYAGLMTYILVPAAPPWYAAHAGIIDEHVHRNAAAGWWDVMARFVDISFSAQWFERQQADVNQVAALPSLHAGFAMLVCVALWPLLRHWLARTLLAAFPIAMGWTLVYGGEHYVVDVLLGWIYVGAIVVGLRLWDRWWSGAGLPRAQNAPGEGASVFEVGRPDEQPLAVDGSGERAADAGSVEGHPDRLEVVGIGGVGDRLEQTVVGSRPLDDDRPPAERPPENEK